MKKLVVVVGVLLMLGVAGAWILGRPHGKPHVSFLGSAPSRAPAAESNPAPARLLPAFVISVPVKAIKPAGPKAAAVPVSDASSSVAIPAPADRLTLREGRGRFGHMRPASTGGQIRAAAGMHVDESPAPEVVIEPAPPQPGGALVPGDLERTISDRRPEIRSCSRQNGRQLQGKVALRWVVGPDGRSTDVQVSDTTVDNAAVLRCVVQRVGRWRFSAPEGGSAQVASTFVFQ